MNTKRIGQYRLNYGSLNGETEVDIETSPGTFKWVAAFLNYNDAVDYVAAKVGHVSTLKRIGAWLVEKYRTQIFNSHPTGEFAYSVDLADLNMKKQGVPREFREWIKEGAKLIPGRR